MKRTLLPMKASETWASEDARAPHVGDVVIRRTTRERFTVTHVGRSVWLHSELSGLHMETVATLVAQFQTKQLKLPFAALAIAIAATLTGCFSYAGISAAPNGTIWIATNTQSIGSPTAEGIYACTLRGPDLVCSRANVRGIPGQ